MVSSRSLQAALLAAAAWFAVPEQAHAGGVHIAVAPVKVGVQVGPVTVSGVIGARPHPNAIWVAGHWDMDPRTRRQIWVESAWRTPPRPGMNWVPGHWVGHGRHTYWVEGHWV